MKFPQFILFIFFSVTSIAQEVDPIEQQLENDTEIHDAETEDDSFLQQLHYYTRHPVNLNEASANELRDFKMLSDLQIQNFCIYRSILGPFVDIYELQAIPSWDIFTIKKILPYIIVADQNSIIQKLKDRFSGGDKNLMMRFSMILPKSKGFLRKDSSASFYLGSRPHILVRYKYNYKNLLQYGLLGDKDGGEQFFSNSQKLGFDFYSFHLFAKKLGLVKSLALGDFTVNLGQGLIHWQSLAFKKSAAVLTVKRQGEVLRPYTSAGEFNFLRGGGITLGKKFWETSMFASIRTLSATLKTDSFQNKPVYISSLLNSGYHRSGSEIKNRNNIEAYTVGSTFKFIFPKWNAGFNWVQYFFSKPLKASDKPYDLYAINGPNWINGSFEYGYTFRNIHSYGEIAVDKHFNIAILQGIIASIDRGIDLAIVVRRIDKKYQTLYGNAFTKNSLPGNESGLYMGICFHPANGWKVDAYTDLYRFPWLRYRVDAPAYCADYLLQLTYIPKKQVEINMRFKRECKQSNEDSNLSTFPVKYIPRRTLRYQVSFQINRAISVRNRVEALWYEQGQERKENGYLGSVELHYQSFYKPFSGNIRLQYFETDGYSSRIYSFENDVLYSYSTPSFFDKGFRWYLNLRTDVSKLIALKKNWKVDLWIKYALSHYFKLDKLGSELDEIQGNHRTEFKFQLILSR